MAGNQIRWRDYEPQTAPAGATYQVKYQAVAGDVYTNDRVVRGSGDVDVAAIPFVPGDITKIVVKNALGTVTYQHGTDFVLDGKNIHWLTSNRPVTIEARGAGSDENGKRRV